MVWRTMLLTITTCFLLGTTFTHWIADHNTLWRSPLTAEALQTSITYYSLLSSAPRGLGWAYIGVGVVALLSAGGSLVKGWQGRGGEVLFDGGSVVLLAAITYNQITEVFPTITMIPSPLPPNMMKHPLFPGLTTAVRDLANDNVITAVMLTGVMLLQAGRYYANRPSTPDDIHETIPTVISTPPKQSANFEAESVRPPSPLTMRSATPFRELTEEESMELNGIEKSGTGRRRNKKR